MSKEIITVRVDRDQREALDRIAQGFDRDRSYILNEAIECYLQMHQWQIEEIERAIIEAEEGDFANEEEVKEVFARLIDEN